MASAMSERTLGWGIALCWVLCIFDLVLGGAAGFFPTQYVAIFHAELDAPQFELIRRTGMIWLAFSAVALRAATAPAATRARWFLVLAVLRLMEVPADIAYASTMSGTTMFGRALVMVAPPLNLAIGWFLYRLSVSVSVSVAASAAASQPADDR